MSFLKNQTTAKLSGILLRLYSRRKGTEPLFQIKCADYPPKIYSTLSCLAHISKRIPRDMAVTLDVRVYAYQTPGRMYRSEGQRTIKTLTSEVISSKGLRYGPDRTEWDKGCSTFSKN